MRYCDFCVMPDSRPGIKFTTLDDGRLKCSACINHENKKNIDYKSRFKELEALCDKHRGRNGKNDYDCAIAVSGVDIDLKDLQLFYYPNSSNLDIDSLEPIYLSYNLATPRLLTTLLGWLDMD